MFLAILYWCYKFQAQNISQMLNRYMKTNTKKCNIQNRYEADVLSILNMKLN